MTSLNGLNASSASALARATARPQRERACSRQARTDDTDVSEDQEKIPLKPLQQPVDIVELVLGAAAFGGAAA